MLTSLSQRKKNNYSEFIPLSACTKTSYTKNIFFFSKYKMPSSLHLFRSVDRSFVWVFLLLLLFSVESVLNCRGDSAVSNHWPCMIISVIWWIWRNFCNSSSDWLKIESAVKFTKRLLSRSFLENAALLSRIKSSFQVFFWHINKTCHCHLQTWRCYITK